MTERERKSRRNKRVYIPNKRVFSAPLAVRQRGGRQKGWKRRGLLFSASSREVATRWDRKHNGFLMCPHALSDVRTRLHTNTRFFGAYWHSSRGKGVVGPTDWAGPDDMWWA
ncbi:unnamed protein product [Cyclocybe aegerita]|uniref:Uncharacterized protein n=1 Tax=Cyclocybe aegerita TaxID=1973307 RepID=A0A8S0WCZ8_CYCAE|nr:unnamed protein product [Cyclocybe aegerita]